MEHVVSLAINSLAMTVQFSGPTKQSALDKAYTTLSQSLSGTFDPMKATSSVSTLLDLASASTKTGVSMFDVLAQGYGAGDSSFDMLSAYQTGG